MSTCRAGVEPVLGRSLVAVVVTSLLVSSSAQARTPQTPLGPASRTVLATASSAHALPAGARFRTALAPGLRTYLVRVPAPRSAEEYATEIAKRPGVFAAQANTVLRRQGLASACADPPDATTADRLVNGVQASAVVAPPTTTPIAILDTGVASDTVGLKGRVLPGFNAVNKSTDTSDVDGHGTEVAAVAASADGRFRGVSPTSPILPITIYNISSETTVDWVVAGIQKAVEMGSKVINISSSNPASQVDSKQQGVLDQAITTAFDQGSIVVVAAGNEGKNNPTVPGSMTKVLNVGSSSAEGTRDAFSNYGPWLDLMSPGANLIVPAPPQVCTTNYGTASGTSFSSPAVAGAAALINAARPELTAQQLADTFRGDAAKDLYNAGWDEDSGWGILDVAGGLSGKAPLDQKTEVDDDVYWLKKNPKKHPTQLKTKTKTSLKSQVIAGKDAQDVYPVYLKKGQTLTATATAGKSTSLAGTAVWSPRTGSFDIGDNRTTYLLEDSGGFTDRPQVQYKASKTGTYYVAVIAPDPPDPTDPSNNDPATALPVAYTLSLKKNKTSSSKKKKSKKSKKK